MTIARARFTEPEPVELSPAVALENFRSKFKVALTLIVLGACLLSPPVAHAQLTMDFVVTAPANTPSEDSIYLTSGPRT